ncbi:hypothetical protein KY331_05840 [Candidatus Woesearchaeota archaeon]|nr:hypothetical protein [Candidatus Woesearchaeota archaeon]
MIKKGFIGICILLLVISIVSAADLSEFPKMFVRAGKADVVVIVGKSAQAEDVVGAIDIVTMLQYKTGQNRQIDVARLDSEVEDLYEQNSIVIGGPCANAASARLLGFPENCLGDFEVGSAIIKLFEFPNNRKSILVAGLTAIDTRRATTVLANYEEHNLTGKEMKIAGVRFSDIQIG